MPRKEGRRGFASIEEWVDPSIRQHRDSKKKKINKNSKERQIIATKNNTNNTIRNRITKTRKQKWDEEQLYGHFKQQTSEISHEKTWTWIRKENLKRETESFQIAAQNNFT